MPPHDIRIAYQAARAKGLRAREAAQSIGVSEGAALAAHIGATEGPTRATPLKAGEWLKLLQSLQPCGPLLALTRNESTVHEKTGVYEKLSAEGPVGIALSEDIDLRLFFHQWHAGLAVTEIPQNPGADAPLPSLQFFDWHGTAVHKIYVRDTSDREAWKKVVEQWSDPVAQVSFEPAASPSEKVAADVDAAAFSEAWSGMTDTHQFFGLLRQHKLERQQAFRLVEGRFARRVDRQAVREMLMDASFDGTPIMVFVGSPGCIQIHTGPVKRIEPMDMNGKTWLNVLDPGFNLHMREDMIEETWVVEKPTSDGVVTSLEAFDTDGELMAMFFGARKPGKPELEAWRELLKRRPTQGATAAA